MEHNSFKMLHEKIKGFYNEQKLLELMLHSIHLFDKSLRGNPSPVILEEDSFLIEVAVSRERQTAN